MARPTTVPGVRPRVAVLDYGSGNVHSALRAVERAGAEVELTRDPQAVQEADDARLDALIRMFARHGCAGAEAIVRARTLYFMQIGYFAMDVREDTSARLALLETYVEVFSGEAPDPRRVQAFKDWVLNLG